MQSGNSHIVFSTKNASIVQNDDSRNYTLFIGASEYQLDRYDFATFRRKIRRADLAALITSYGAGIEIIDLPKSGHFIILDIGQLIEVKDLIAGTTAMLDLNTSIHKDFRQKALHY